MYELLTSTTSVIFCLVRMNITEDTITNILRRNNLYLSIEQLKRLKIIPADISTANFGMNESEILTLQREVDVVLHCAGRVDVLADYSSLVESNVLTTLQVILFCMQQKIMLLHVSSSAALPFGPAFCKDRTNWDDNMTFETRDLLQAVCEWNDHGALYRGYMQSKWMAEVIVWIAAEKFGLYRLKVIRPANIYNSLHEKDLFNEVVRLCRHTMIYPLVNSKCAFGWVTLKSLSEYIVILSHETESDRGFLRNSASAHHPITSGLGIDKLFKSSKVLPVPVLVWVKRVLSSSITSERLQSFLGISFYYSLVGLIGYCELPLSPSSDFSHFHIKEVSRFMEAYKN